MASSLKSTLQPRRALGARRRRPPLAPDLALAPPPRPYVKTNVAIPGTAAAYAWLAADLVLAACVLLFALWLAVGLPIERAAPWAAWRTL